MTKLPRQPIRCFAGLFFRPDQSCLFSIVCNEKHGWFVWEGRTIPDQFKQADGHVYELLWDDEWVQADLVEETTRLKLLLNPIWPIDVYVMTPADNNFYLFRNRVRELGREASRTEFEELVAARLPDLIVG